MRLGLAGDDLQLAWIWLGPTYFALTWGWLGLTWVDLKLTWLHLGLARADLARLEADLEVARADLGLVVVVTCRICLRLCM